VDGGRLAPAGRVSAVMRRLALSAGALVVAASFSSCSSVDRGDTVAEVNGVELSRHTLAALANDSSAGGDVRAALTAWVQVASASDNAADIGDREQLLTESNRIIGSVLAEVGDASRVDYEKGLDGGSFLCLAAITLGTDVPGADVIAELTAGKSFADAATQYSTTDRLAQSGGVVADQQGSTCFDQAAFDAAFPQIRGVLTEAGASVGEPVVVSDASGELVLVLRAYDDLKPAEQRVVAQSEISAVLSAKVAAADITVSPRVGRWDPLSSNVVPVGEG